MISTDPDASCKMMKSIFQSNISDAKIPTDPALANRGIRWMHFLKGGHAEFHFCPASTSMRHVIPHLSVANNVIGSNTFDNHIGMSVPDLTSIVSTVLKLQCPCHLTKRSDGRNQFYFKLDGCVDFIEVDSDTINLNAISKVSPSFHESTFSEDSNMIAPKIVYYDPNHNKTRTVVIKNDVVSISGKDGNSKTWHTNGRVLSNGKIQFDFSNKGGPSSLLGTRTENGIEFEDGNTWQPIQAIFR
jgi:hypothetical protein